MFTSACVQRFAHAYVLFVLVCGRARLHLPPNEAETDSAEGREGGEGGESKSARAHTRAREMEGDWGKHLVICVHSV